MNILLTPPPTYQGLKRVVAYALELVGRAFNTPSNIPRIETAATGRDGVPPDYLLTPPPTYQGLKQLNTHYYNRFIYLLTPPPTYQGLKRELVKEIGGLEMPFNTPSNIPRIETAGHEHCAAGIPQLLTPPPTYQGLKQKQTPDQSHRRNQLLTPPPTYQGLKLISARSYFPSSTF